MGKLKPVIIVFSILIILTILVLVAHEMIEARIFRSIANQPGVQLRIGRRHGNLLHGYTLNNIEINQSASGNTPSFTITTPEMSIHWKLQPFSLTELSWDEGVFKIQNADGTDEDIDFDACSLQPGNPGWLQPPEPIQIGPDSWNGTLNLKIRTYADEIDGEIVIANFPSRMISLFGDIPRGTMLPPQVRIEATISGPLNNPQTDASVMDPFTRQEYSF